MGTNYNPNTIQPGFESTDLVNAELAKIAAEFANMIHRDGVTPNDMNADLDMGSNKLLNVAEGALGTDGVNLNQVTNVATDIATTIITSTQSGGGGNTTGDPITFNYRVATGSQGLNNNTEFDLDTLFGVTEFNGLTVAVNGVIQTPGLAYSVTDTTLVTFTESLLADTDILFVFGDLSPTPVFSNVNATLGETAVVATAGQTVFTAPTYVIGQGQLLVSIDGVLQSLTQGDYTETTTTSITLDEAMNGGESIVIRNITGI